MKTNTPIIIKTMKQLSLSVVFFFICQITFGQSKTILSNETLADPNIPESTHHVTIVKTSEQVVSKDSDKPKNFERTGQKPVYQIGRAHV